MEAPATRFQREVDPEDEGREGDMRMIFDELRREIKAAMEKNTRTLMWSEEAKEGARGSIFHIKQPSQYKYNYNNWL